MGILGVISKQLGLLKVILKIFNNSFTSQKLQKCLILLFINKLSKKKI